MADENNNSEETRLVISELDAEQNTEQQTKNEAADGKFVTFDEAEAKRQKEQENATTFSETENETTFNQKEKETTVNENGNETEVKEKAATKTPPKTEENDDGKTGEGPEIERKDDNKEEEGDEDKGPFKEGDIIQYMYTDWLIGGMNWLWTYSSKKIKKGWWKLKRKAARKDAEKAKHKDIEKYDVYKLKDKYGKKAIDDAEKKTEEFEKYNGLVEMCDKIRDGKLDETNLPESVKTMIKDMPEKDFKKFFDSKRIKKAQENIKDNLIAATQFANLYAETSMLEAKIQNAGYEFEKGNDKEFEKKRKEGLTLFAKAMSREAANGGNTSDLSEKLLKQVQKASETAHKNIMDGHFADYKPKKGILRSVGRKITGRKSGKPKPNQSWNNVNRMLEGIGGTEKPLNLFESMIIEQNFDKTIEQQFEGLKREDAANQALKENLERRKKRLEEIRARVMSDPEKRIARLQKEGERGRKRIELINRLRNPDYVVTYNKGADKGKQDEDFTRRLRERFGIDGR